MSGATARCCRRPPCCGGDLGRGAGPVEFNFDWSFDFYPLAYARPGPEMRIYRLKGGVCSGKPSGA